MQVLERGNIIEIWVPNGTSETNLASVKQKYIAKGFHPVVYRSGSTDLSMLTASLLMQNK